VIMGAGTEGGGPLIDEIRDFPFIIFQFSFFIETDRVPFIAVLA